MLKKLSIAGLALIASSGIAFADPSDSNTVSDNSGSATDASMSTTTGDAASTTTTTTTTMHKKHHRHHKKHHRHHHVAAAPADDMVAAPKGDYKGEVAAPCPTCPVPFHPGAYAGLSVGSLLNYSSRPAVYNGFQGTLFGGYGWMWDQWYGALEIFVQDSAQMTNYTRTNGNMKSTWGYGLSVLPGYTILENVLGYLRLGVVETRFSANNGQWRTGGQIGLGLDAALCTNWDLRGEYIFSFYNSLSHGGLPKSQQFDLGLIYKFEL